MYWNGPGVSRRTRKRNFIIWKRLQLGCVEEENGRLDKAAKHWIIATKLGDDIALSSLRVCYTRGLVEKDDYASS
eukprot:scaffold6008_cov110-Skeletonema_dohrnii-CCMP3373.AAC.1